LGQPYNFYALLLRLLSPLLIPQTRQVHLHDKAVDQSAANAFAPFVPFPGFKPNPFRTSPAIHTATHALNWTNLWTRRRSYHSFEPPQTSSERRRLMDPPPVNNVSVGDVSLMAWPDNHWRYIFTSKNATRASVADGGWQGGYDTLALDIAERYSYSSFRTYRDLAPPEWVDRTSINSTYMGTCTGLTKMPYIRDGRRSVGVDDFIMTLNNTHDLAAAPDCAAIVGHGTDIWGHRMMEHPINNSQPGVAKCATTDKICNAYPEYMRKSPQGGCGRTCFPLRALTNKKVSNLWVSGYTAAQTMMVNSALRMHPEEFQVGVGSGAAAAHMALSGGRVASTEAATKAPAVVAAIRARILKHAPLHRSAEPKKTWPAAVGYACSEQLKRCVQVPGGGAFSTRNTKPACAQEPATCGPALKSGEWLATLGSFEYDSAKKTATFKFATRVKKSTINSSLLEGSEYVAVSAHEELKLLAAPSEAFKVDGYSYVLVRCVEVRCEL
jgi:hypothetical protein